MSIAASEGERMSSRDEDSAALPPSSGILHHVLSPRGWTIGSLGWSVLVLSAPPQYLSFRKCMRK